MKLHCIITTIAFSIVCLMTFVNLSHASVEEYQHAAIIGGSIRTATIIVGFSKDKADIIKLANLVTENANQAYNQINSDIAKLNSSPEKKSIIVGWQTAECLAKAIEVSNWIKKDILSSEGSTGSYKDITVDQKNRTVMLKKDGLKIQVYPLISGYLADLMIRYIHSSGMKNAMVKVGNVFRGIGNSTHGPWKIQVQEDSSVYAKHALNITVTDTGAATVSSTQFPGKMIYDPSKKQRIKTLCKGATMIMNESVYAEGVAYAMMLMDPSEGIKALTRIGSAKGLIVENSGKFLRFGL